MIYYSLSIYLKFIHIVSKYASMSFIKSTVPFIYALMIQMLKRSSLSHVIGLKAVSLSAGLTPLIGFFSDVNSALLVYLVRTASILSVAPSMGACSLYLPTLCGTLYLSTQSRLLKVGIPLVSILLFLNHPVGFISWTYTLYWIPPLLLGFLTIKSIFLRAVASTLTTHAVGSVLWIYMHQTSPMYWQTLINIVWLERLIYALILTAGYYVVSTVRSIDLSSGSLKPQLRWGI